MIRDSAALGGRLLRHWSRRERDDVADIIKAKLFVTRRCNLDCVHCGIGGAGFDGAGELSTEQILALWKNNPGLQLVSLSGGEPFLRDDLTEIAVPAARLPRLLALSVNTNGWYTDRVVDFVGKVHAALGPSARLYIAVSSDGPPAAHAAVRRNDESWARKEATLRALRSLAGRLPSLRIRHNVNVNRWNLDGIVEFVEAAEARGERCFVSMYSASRHYSHRPEHHRELKDFRRELTTRPDLLRRLSRHGGFLGNRFLTLAEDFYEREEREQPVPCFSLRASVIVEPDGMVRPCINFPVDLGRAQDHGFSLAEVTRSEQADALRAQIREGRCPICWTPNEAFPTLMCNLPNPTLWKRPGAALRRLTVLRG